MPHYQVVVGNIGVVYDGDNRTAAVADYLSYVRDVQLSVGRCSGESVALFTDDELTREYQPPMYEAFAKWTDVIDHVRSKQPIYYRAPMDIRPHRVSCRIHYRGRSLRVIPPTTAADAFTANRDHLLRFSRLRDRT